MYFLKTDAARHRLRRASSRAHLGGGGADEALVGEHHAAGALAAEDFLHQDGGQEPEGPPEVGKAPTDPAPHAPLQGQGRPRAPGSAAEAAGHAASAEEALDAHGGAGGLGLVHLKCGGVRKARAGSSGAQRIYKGNGSMKVSCPPAGAQTGARSCPEMRSHCCWCCWGG